MRQRIVLVLGAGPIGLLYSLYTQITQGATVLLVDVNRRRLEWAVRHGVVPEGNALLDSPHLKEAVDDLTAGKGVDAVYVCTPRGPARSAVARALECARAGSCIDLAVGFADDDSVSQLPGLDLNGVRRANTCGLPVPGKVHHLRMSSGQAIWVTGHRGSGSQHLVKALRLLARHAERLTSIVTHVVSLLALPTVLDDLIAPDAPIIRGAVPIKVAVDMRSSDFSIQAVGISGLQE